VQQASGLESYRNRKTTGFNPYETTVTNLCPVSAEYGAFCTELRAAQCAPYWEETGQRLITAVTLREGLNPAVLRLR
jgi:hypothetical protein